MDERSQEMYADERGRKERMLMEDYDPPPPCDYCGHTEVPGHIDFELGVICQGCEEDLVTIQTPRCPACKESATYRVREQDWRKYQVDVHVQDAFPYLSAGQRERLISGICESCWEAMFGGMET